MISEAFQWERPPASGRLVMAPLDWFPTDNAKCGSTFKESKHRIKKLSKNHNSHTTTPFLMSSTSLLRVAARAQPSTFFRANGLRSLTPRSSSAMYALPAMIATTGSTSSFSTTSIRRSDDGHGEESFEEFTARYRGPQLVVDSFWACAVRNAEARLTPIEIVNC